MDYRAHYNRLIKRAHSRTLEGYCERHHIIPRCLEGDDNPSNIVHLTPEEHYIAHLLLVKIHPESYGLLWAAVQMTGKVPRQLVDKKSRNKLYGWLRRRFSEMLKTDHPMRGRHFTEASKEKMRLAKLGKKRAPHTEETKEKMRLAAEGKPRSEAHCLALAEAKRGKPGNHHVPHTDEAKGRIKSGLTPEVIAKRSATRISHRKKAPTKNAEACRRSRDRKRGLIP